MDFRIPHPKFFRINNVWIPFALLAFIAGTLGSSAAMAARPEIINTQNQTTGENSLNTQVYDRLTSLPWYNIFDHLEYTIQGKTVTVTGQVVFPLSTSAVGDSLTRISGIDHVVNHVQDLSVSPVDNQLRWAEYRALFYGGSPLFRYSLGVNPAIHIIVNNSHVTLIGAVSNRMDRQIAGMRARTAFGAITVTNHLQVQH